MLNIQTFDARAGGNVIKVRVPSPGPVSSNFNADDSTHKKGL